MNTHPLVTVITPCYNSARYLAETIESVRAQDYPHLEHLVIDGSSTDGTLEILQRYADRLTWISEPDKGQSDAINKGFRRARGEIVAWLNADDLYFPWTVRVAVEAFHANLQAGMVYGASVLINAEGQVIAERPAQAFDLRRLLDEGDYISQPTVFMRRAALETVGLLRTDLHYCMDYDLWLRLGKHLPVCVAAVPPLAQYRLHADSKTTYIPYAMIQERYAIAQSHGGNAAQGTLNVLYTKWATHVSEEFTAGPAAFAQRHLGSEFQHLPDEVRKRVRPILGNVYVQAGFRAHHAQDTMLAAQWFFATLKHNPKWIFNRGVLAVLVRFLLKKAHINLPPGIMHRIYTGLRKVLFTYILSGNSVQCNICGWQGLKFSSQQWHVHTTCPNCQSEIRHRLFFALLSEINEFSFEQLVKDKDVLHFAPEPALRPILQNYAASYVTADLIVQESHYDGIDIRLNITDMHSIADGQFDLIIVFDVLEHVPQHIKAMREIYRVLRAGGYAALTVPQKDHLEKTFEDPTIIIPEDRERIFGQRDHLRIYGDDFPAILASVGFEVTCITEKSFSEKSTKKYVLFPPVMSSHPLATNFRKVFLARRPVISSESEVDNV